MNFEDEQRALLRALHAFNSRMAEDARAFRVPSFSKSTVATVNGLKYVRVADASGVLQGVYRVTPRQLKRLKRWPDELNSPTPTTH